MKAKKPTVAAHPAEKKIEAATSALPGNPPVIRPITAMNEDELAQLFKSWGELAFRATQLRDFLFRQGVVSLESITNLSKSLRERLAREAPLYELTFSEKSDGDDATKWLWKAKDGALIESVQIRTPDRVTTCVSSQVGCAMGCVFCASGLGGLERHLQAHEILEQYLQMWARSGLRSSHVVFMGMGEPFHNYEEVIKSIRMLNNPPPKGAGVGARRITVSTVGIVPGILKLGEEKMQIELAISLHAPDEETRRKLIPASKRYPIREVMSAVEEYWRKTRRIVTYEYVLLAGVNDSFEQAGELTHLLRNHSCKVNLIPFNPVHETPYQRPSQESQERFKDILEKAHIPVTIRYSKGRNVDAACGQLRRRTLSLT